MATYGGFAPGTYQPWALNLLTSIFGSPGIARGMAVNPTSPAGMAVLVGVDSTAQDGVCYLPNGGFVRIDAPLQLSIAANGTGSTRTDAVVASVDPTGGSVSLGVQSNWSTGFNGTSNQLVLALISVPSGASSITSGNITQNSATAKLGNAGGAANSMTASDGIGVGVTDNSTTGILSIQVTGLTTTQGRSLALVAIDTSSLGHLFLFGTNGAFVSPGAVAGTSFSTAGGLSATAVTVSGSGVALMASGGTRIFTGTATPTGASEGDIWVKA